MPIGTVRWFNPTKGYGYIAPDDGGPDVFVHISAVQKAGLVLLPEGDKISYEPKIGRSGKISADNLRLIYHSCFGKRGAEARGHIGVRLMQVSKASLWRGLSDQDIEHRFRTEGPSRPQHRLPVGTLHQQISLDGFALSPAAPEAQGRPSQHIGSAMAVSRDCPQQVNQRGRRELPRIHINSTAS